MNAQNQQDLFFEHDSRNLGAQPQQSAMPRQSSRPMDGYGGGSNGPFRSEEQGPRYEPQRFDRLNPSMQNNGYGFDMNTAQTWNAGPFSSHSYNAFAQTSRNRPQARGRGGLPPVSQRLGDTKSSTWILTSSYRHGLTSLCP